MQAFIAHFRECRVHLWACRGPLQGCGVGGAAHQSRISTCSSQCLNHPDVPAAETTTQTKSKGQGKSASGKRKKKKEGQWKEESQEKGPRKSAGILSSVLPGIKGLEQLVCLFHVEGGCCHVLTYLERLGQQEGGIMAPLLPGCRALLSFLISRQTFRLTGTDCLSS